MYTPKHSAPIVHFNSETAHGFGAENYPLFFLISKKEKGVLCKKRITVFYFFCLFPLYSNIICNAE